MQVIPNIKPPPRLLNTAAADLQVSAPTGNDSTSKHKLKRGNSGGNRRAIIIGLLLGTLAVVAGGYLFQHPESAEHQYASVRRFLPVRTRSVSVPPPNDNKPDRLRVEIHPSMLRVTAIALGHPRLAIINGKEVTEGESLTVNSPDAPISVTLQVVNIVEGRIELTDGTKIITAPLASSTIPQR